MENIEAGLPSAADLDAVNAELELANKTAGAKAAHDVLIADLTAPASGAPQPPPPVIDFQPNQGPAVAPEPPKEMQVSRHGEVFDPTIHAQLPTGDPKTDSAGKFIFKEHDYPGPRKNSQFPD